MKKIVTLILVLASISLYGQVRDKYENYGQVLYRGFSEELPVKDQTLYKNKAGYVLVQYTSELEQPMEMHIGKTREAAEFTLNRLIEMSDRQNARFVITVNSMDYYISSTTSFLGKGVLIKPANKKGTCYIAADQMSMMLEVL